MVLAVTVLITALPFAIRRGSYNFTAAMAAGVSRDRPCIDTGGYRIYYHTFSGQWEDGTSWEMPGNVLPVKKHFWGWTVAKENRDCTVRVSAKDKYIVGMLITIEGKSDYYNMISINISPTCTDLVSVDAVQIGGEQYDVAHGFCFVTPEEVKLFQIGDAVYHIMP